MAQRTSLGNLLHSIRSQPYFQLENTRVAKADFGGGPFGRPDDWLPAVLTLNGTSSRFLINVGAHMTQSDVVARVMSSDDVEGIAMDADDRMAWVGKRVAKHTGFVTPQNVNALLDAARAPERPLLLKVDIDSYDVDVALAVLHQRSPDFVFVEINEKVPPPVCYCNRYHNRWRREREWRRLDVDSVGCSLQAYVLAFVPRGYRLVSVLMNDALFAHERVPLPPRDGLFLETKVAYEAGYARVPSRAAAFWWNTRAGLDAWIDESRPWPRRSAEIMAFYAKWIPAGMADFHLNATTWPCQHWAPAVARDPWARRRKQSIDTSLKKNSVFFVFRRG